MKSLQETVVTAMDGTDNDIFEFLPYIVQDIWEIGADPQAIIQLTRKHVPDTTSLKVLDLGCGKGAVSVIMAKYLNCSVLGIDAIPEFIEYAKKKAEEYGVAQLCAFKVGDTRQEVSKLSGFDVVVLGSIGPVLGNYLETLTTVEKCLNKDGIVIIDDAFLDDESDYSHPLILKKSQVIEQAAIAGFDLLEVLPCPTSQIIESEDVIFSAIEKRCKELMAKRPGKAYLFEDYIASQEVETDVNINKAVCVTMVFARRGPAR